METDTTESCPVKKTFEGVGSFHPGDYVLGSLHEPGRSGLPLEGWLVHRPAARNWEQGRVWRGHIVEVGC